MAKYSNTVEYNLKTTLDASGVAKLQTELRGVQQELQRMSGIKMITHTQSQDAIRKIKEIEKALTKAFNTNLGMLNIDQFTKSLSKGNNSINDWAKSFNLAGSQGQMAMTSLIGRLGQVDTGLKSVSKTTDKVFNTIGNTVRWGLIASAFQSVMNNAHEAVQYIKDLDKSLNDIRIVSDYNAQDMREFSLYANEAAKALGQTTVAYTDASLIFAQQGFNLEDSNELAEYVLKVANTTGQATNEVSEQITSWMNGYQMNIDQVGETLDKVTKVAAVGAADTEELMTAASKVASTAHMLGVTEDQLITQMSTIISVTREAPENVGNALKTIYARLGDLQMGETLEDGTDLGNLSKTLQDVGIQVVDDTGAMRNMGDVLEELMGKWSSFDRSQQQALAVKLAGKYQYSRFSALMQNEEMYQSQLQESMDSTGFLERTQDIYMESLEAKSKSLQAATEGLISNLFDPDTIKPFEEGLIVVVDLLGDLVKSVGGGIPIMTAFGAVATKVFSKNIANNINNFVSNRKRDNQTYVDQQSRIELFNKGLKDEDLVAGGKDVFNFVKDNVTKTDIMSDSQLEQYNTLVQQSTQNVLALKDAEDKLKQSVAVTNEVMAARYGLQDAVTYDKKTGMYNTSQLDQLIFMNEDLNPSEIANETMKKYFDGASNAMTNLGSITPDFEELFKTKDVDAFMSTFTNRMESISSGIVTMRESGIASKETLKMLSNGYQDIQAKVDKLNKSGKLHLDSEDAQKSIRELMTELENLRKRLLEANKQKVDPLVGQMHQNIANKDAAAAAHETDKSGMNQFSQSIESTKKTYDITQMVGSIGELAFAWQSFQSLGSLWANADMDTGEKLQSTILNLAMTFPMLINGFSQFKKLSITTGPTQKLLAISNEKATKSQEALTDAQRKGALAQAQLARGSQSGTQKMQAQAAAATRSAIANKAASVAVKGLGKAFSLLGGPIGIAMLAISAITTVISGLSEANKQALEKAKEAASEATEKYTTAKDAQISFEETYKSYQEGTASLEEMQNAAKEVSTVFGDNIDQTAILTDNFDALSDSIADATEKEHEQAKDKNQQLIDENKKSLEDNGFLGTGLGNQNAWNDIKNALPGAQTLETYSGYAVAVNTDLGDQIDQMRQSGDIIGAIGLAKKELERYEEEKKNIQKQIDALDDKDSDEYKKLETSYKSAVNSIQKINDVLELEDIKTADEAGQQQAAFQAQDLLAEVDKNLSAKDIIGQLESGEGELGSLVNGMTSYSDKLSFAIANTNDEVLKLKLQAEKASADFESKFSENLTTTLENSDIDISKMGVGSKEEYAQQASSYLMDQIDSSGLTDKEKIEFIGSLDPNATYEEIQNQINNINTDGSLPKLEFEPTLTDRSDFSEEEISNLLKDTGMSESAYNRMSADIFDQSALGDSANAIESQISALEDQKKAAVEAGESTEDLEKQIKDLREDYEDLGDTASDIAAYNLKMNKGVSNLTNSWEELGSVLKDDAAKGTSDWYQALGELDGIMSDILNIDVGVLSNDFYNNADALDAMSRAADGDVSAIDDLRRIASEDIVTHLQVENISDEDKDYLINNELLPMMNDLQSYLDGQPLGTEVDVNTDPFIGKLNELLQLGQITAEQASNILSSIGMDATIDMKTESSWQDHSAQYPRFSVETDPDTGMMTGLKPDGVETVTWQSYDEISYPTIEGAAYTGSGVQTVGGKSSGNSGKKSGGGGKGGGGGSKAKEPKKKDPIEEEIDRYERVDTLLGAIEKDYDKINNERDRLAGWNIADNMNKEIDLLQKQILLHEEKLKIQREEQKELANDLANKYGGRFDADGFLTNYEAIHRKLESDVNNLINQYNNTSDEAGQEALEEQIEAAQKVLDSFKEDYKRYDELVSSDLKETINTIEDLKDSIEDLRIEAFQTQIEAADNIKDINESLIDFNAVLSGLDKDDPFRGMATSAAKLKNYFDDAGGAVEDYYDKLISRSKEALNDPAVTDAYRDYLTNQISLMEQAKSAAKNGEIEQYGLGYLDMAFTNLSTITDQIKQFQETGDSAIFGENEGEMYEVAKDVFDQAVQMVEDLEDAIGDLRDSIIDGIDDIGERIEERQNQYENITEELEHQRDIIELLHGDRSYQEINMVLAAQQNNYQQSIKEMQESLELWKDLREGLIEGSEEWKTVNEQIEETQKELNDLVEESLNNLREQYENTVNDILDSWSNSPFGNDLDWIEEEWELINRNADYYLDQTNAAYETQKLQGEYLKLLDGSNDLHIQQLISEQMKEQLGYLREKKNISEYDVAYANAQLEILQKRIALEEAQRNKNQIKLRRDSQGNYSYVYTADQDDIADKEGDLLDAKNNAYNLSKEQMKQTQADSLSALGDAKNLLNNIWNDANLTLEEKKKRTETVINSLKEYLDGTSEQLSTSQKNIINDFIGMVDMMTDENSERLKDVYTEIINGNHDAFDQIDTRWSTSLTDWLQNLDEFKDNTDKAFEDLTNNADEYQNQIDQVGDLIKTDFDDIATSVENVKNKTDDLAASQKDFINQLKNDAGTIKEYEKTLGEYTAKISDAENAMKAYKDQVNELGNTIKAKEQENAALTSQVKDLQSTVNAYKEGTIGGGSGGGGGNYGGHNLNEMAEGVAGNIWVYGGWGNNPRRHSLMKQKFGDAAGDQLYAAVQAKFNSGYGYRGGLEHSWSYYKSFYPSNFDTGGYTGTWANGDTDGRLAMLHQKEIVLNATDTANLLEVVQTVRDMTSQMKGSLLGNIVELMQNNSPVAKDTSDTLQQEVHITAEFPNVESSDEIREALLGLNDQAMQYAARER